MLHKNQSILWVCISLICCFYLLLIYSTPAFASIHEYPESSNQIMYRSVQSLRDTQERAWQVVLYKRVRSGLVNSITLRLVGFPGTELVLAIPLTLTAGTGQVWTIPAMSLLSSLPTNVAEYDFKEVMALLKSTPPLRLDLPIKGKSKVELIIPTFAVREWRLLLEQGS